MFYGSHFEKDFYLEGFDCLMMGLCDVLIAGELEIVAGMFMEASRIMLIRVEAMF